MSSEGYIAADEGVRLYFEKLGAGEPAVVIPNGFCYLDDFRFLSRTHTLIVYDVRNRGRSDSVSEPGKLSRGVLNDIDDLELVRRHFALDRMTLVGHSYVGLTVVVYAMRYPGHADRILQIGPMQPSQREQYAPPLMVADGVMQSVFARIGELQKARASMDAEAFCRQSWAILGEIFVTDPAHAARVAAWGRCELANERMFMKYWMEHVLPSLQRLELTEDDFASVDAPVLTMHGNRDRSAPYGGGRDWARQLPNARLMTIDGAGHAPWIESPDAVFDAIDTFIGGAWPDAAVTTR